MIFKFCTIIGHGADRVILCTTFSVQCFEEMITAKKPLQVTTECSGHVIIKHFNSYNKATIFLPIVRGDSRRESGNECDLHTDS